MSEQDYTWYGEPWRRVVATLIDLAILFIPFTVMLFFISRGESGEALMYTGIVLGSGMIMFYKMILEGSVLMATPGKRAMDLKVVTLHGEQMAYAGCALRSWPFWLTGAMVGVTGQFIALLAVISLAALALIPFTARRQGLHDLMARAIVVHRAQAPGTNADADESSADEQA